MARYFRSCKQVTAGFGGAGCVTGVLVALWLLLPLYDDPGVVISQDSYKIKSSLEEEKIKSMKTENLKDPLKVNVDCKQTLLGLMYRGYANTTSAGHQCNHWQDNQPHMYRSLIDANFPDGSVAAAKNYCRNPDRSPKGPWCYTVSPKLRWQYCDVRLC